MKLRLLLALSAIISGAAAWGNGFSIYDNDVFVNDYTLWQRTEMYGTHDYFAQKAWEMLAEQAPEEADWISERLYYYGTELPDSAGFEESIGDIFYQTLRFDKDGNALDDSLAAKPKKKFYALIDALDRGNTGAASKMAGVIVSYVSNAGLFARVIDSYKGAMYEIYLLQKTDIVYPSDDFEDRYGEYITFDGELEMISPYDATMRLGRATFLGEDGKCSAQWMEQNYDLEDSQFIECEGRNFNNLINALVDVLHTAYQVGVKGKPYEWNAYDWANYEEPAPTEPEEPEQESGVPQVPNLTMPPAEEKPEPVYEPPAVTGKKTDTSPWVYLLLGVVLIAAIAALTFLNMMRSSKPKRKSSKRTRPSARRRR